MGSGANKQTYSRLGLPDRGTAGYARQIWPSKRPICYLVVLNILFVPIQKLNFLAVWLLVVDPPFLFVVKFALWLKISNVVNGEIFLNWWQPYMIDSPPTADTRGRQLLKPALVQDTDNEVDKTYHLAQYVGPFEAYLELQWPLYGSKGVSVHQKDWWNVAVNSRYLKSSQKTITFGQKQPQQIIWLRKLNIYVDI